MNIRPFEPEDWPEFIRLMRELHQEGELQSLKLSERYLLASLQKPGLFHAMAFSGDRAIGVCMGWVEDTFFGPDLVGNLHILYVVPEARGGILGKSLLGVWERWCTERGAKELWVSQATGIAVESTTAFFDALGFHPVGVIAKKAVSDGRAV